jgi:hypothetical protein
VTPIFRGGVRGGKIEWDQPFDMREHVASLEGRRIEATIQAERSKRTIQQAAYWFAVPVKILSAHTGYEKDEMSHALLGEWRGYHDGPFGGQVPICASITELSIPEFSELIDWVQQWAAEKLEVQIPAPSEVDYDGDAIS